MRGNQRAACEALCARLGDDPLLVQGAGGNVSWKDGDELWIKASGRWLANAGREETFVAVDLDALRRALTRGDYEASPKVTNTTTLRPSIETMLHALLPDRVVVHLHAIEVLAHLVRETAEASIGARLAPLSNLAWVFVPYHKPGAPLAQAIAAALAAHSPATVDAVFLGNHGIVLGGEDAAEVATKLDVIVRASAIATEEVLTSATTFAQSGDVDSRWSTLGYRPASDPMLHALARDPVLHRRLGTDWALYPDHVVFLGAQAEVADDADVSRIASIVASQRPPFVFVSGRGTLELATASAAHRAQLRCYFDVLVRQSPIQRLNVLDAHQVAELLGWEAERYRQAPSVRLDTR